MRKIELKSRKLLRTIFGGISLTAIAFIFQACYGMDRDFGYDIKLTGTVTSKTTNQPVKDIKVCINDKSNFGITDENGKFDFYAYVPDRNYYGKDSILYTPDSVRVHFFDIDGIENGHFADTTVIIHLDHKNEVKIDMELRDKQ